MRLPMLVVTALAVAALGAPRAVVAQDAAAFFEDNCAGCHTIGGGAQAGPDLKGVTARRDRDWLVRFMLDPPAFASDPEVARMIKDAGGASMPATDGLTRELAGAIVTLIDQRSGAAPAATRAAAAEAPFTEADVARGREIFSGASRLSGAGPACMACHESGDVLVPGGGRLGPDLTRVIDRLGGRHGLGAWLRATPTPMMRAVYRPAPLSADEARALTAFLEHTDAVAGPRPGHVDRFTKTAAALAAAALALIGVAWARRFRAVRRPLVAATRGPAGGTARNAPGAAAAGPAAIVGGGR